jgi:long-chain acyl-CoA synthetase
LGEEAVEHIIKLCELNLIVTTKKQIPLILKCHKGFIKHLIVVEDQIEKDLMEKLQKEKIQLYTFDEVYQLGKENPSKHVKPDADDVATISFTSGTTGTPKGALLTHGNLTNPAVTTELPMIYGEEVHISYLPLAHVFERLVQTVFCKKTILFYKKKFITLDLLDFSEEIL